jgi:hypothetical protein
LSEGVKQKEERGEAAIIYFEFPLQHSPEGKKRGKLLISSVWLLRGNNWAAEYRSTFRKLPVRNVLI